MPRAAIIESTAPITRDPLAHLLARGRISDAQFRAAQEFRKHYGAAKKGQLIPDGARGGTDSSAGKWLTKAYRELGQDGSSLTYDVLIQAMTVKQIAEARGLVGPQWSRYFGKRLEECLTTLAITYGFASEDPPRTRRRTLP